ncbi:type II toxin-antitoxin system RelE/ParE family toxin [Aureimonas ureilytica]|uniref:type II toxin-antitoxin system RelE/ParE family toxin n=1 Tax=Aureimonas ureilytica TaxID=401562 RepID=UPI000360FEA7|nr:type II toxin-antitoxin system RelE/ParE family toxin [Aureimonas ureilytica]
MAPKVQLTPKARQDLADIFRYTAREWSLAQATAYLAELRRAIEGLATGQTRSRTMAKEISGFEKSLVRSHLIIHRRSENRIEVVRVLHARMDIDRHM